MAHVDLSNAAGDYAKYRSDVPVELLDHIERRGFGAAGGRVLDIGTGSGAMARCFARRGCRVVGVDKCAPLIEQARRIDAEQGLAIDYVVAGAERTGLEGHSFDGVCALQCWSWLDSVKALRELRRVAKPGAWLVIASIDCIPLPENVVEATEHLIGEYNNVNRLGGSGIYPEWLRDVRQVGCTAIETFSFDVLAELDHEAWRGRVRASAGVGGSMSTDTVARFDERLRGLLLDRFPGEPLSVPYCVWSISCRLPG